MSDAAQQATVAAPDDLASALAGDARWVWCLPTGLEPRADALERLLAAVAPEGEPPAAIVAGLVLDTSGRPAADALPGFGPADVAEVLRVLPHELCPIRHADLANCLVARFALERHGLPDAGAYGPHAAREWTARVLRDEPGRFCAASVAVRTGPAPIDIGPRPAGALRSLGPTVRAVRAGTWNRGESLRALAAVAREAGLRRPRRAAVR